MFSAKVLCIPHHRVLISYIETFAVCDVLGFLDCIRLMCSDTKESAVTQEGLQDDEDAIEHNTQKKLEAVQDKLPGIC